MRHLKLTLIVLIAAGFVQLSAQSKRPFTFEDMMALKRISNPEISPDGKSILFTSEAYPDCNDDPCNKSRDEQRANSKVRAMIFTRLFYRHWSTYTRFKRTHLFVVPSGGGTARDITPGDHDVPPFSL